MADMILVFDALSGTIIPVLPVEKSDEEWKESLSPEAFRIARQGGTEPAFSGIYHNNHKEGLYRCICCGTDLFLSADKFYSGTGWPSFSRTISDRNIRTRTDRSFGMIRTEVICARCGAHLGHLFEDGPPPTGLRYCMNSGTLSFYPRT